MKDGLAPFRSKTSAAEGKANPAAYKSLPRVSSLQNAGNAGEQMQAP